MSGHVYWCEVCQRNVWDTHICNPAGDIEGRAEIKGKIMDLAKQLPDGSSEMFDEISELLDQLDKDELVEVLEYLNHIITINKYWLTVNL
jgi:hypothetical protein